MNRHFNKVLSKNDNFCALRLMIFADQTAIGAGFQVVWAFSEYCGLITVYVKI